MRGLFAALRATAVMGALGWSGAIATGAELAAEQVEFFEAKVRPILVESCYKCHSVEAGKSKGDLFVDSRDGLLKGGASGLAIVPGKPDESLLIRAVRYKDEDLQMPPEDEGGKLSAEKVAVLEEWIRVGAPDPRVGGKPHPMDMEAARRHWAFQPVVRPAVPGGGNAGTGERGDAEKGARAVDAFVGAKLKERGLGFAPEADRRTWLRRVTYDLTGLPPTAEEVEAFSQDRAPDAYAKVVERLLASPRYGERWGRYWLDVARFADTKGYLAGNVERRYAFSHTYRDYVIRAFNEDRPFDRFVVEQIAADHLPLGEDKSALAGLGFLTLGRRFLNNQNDIIDDRIDVVTRGLMGLTVSCARCHDHKFDPVPTKDYYALHGVFASSEEPEEKPLLGPLVESEAYREFLRKSAEVQKKIEAREAEEVDKFLAEARRETGSYLLAVHEAPKRKPDEKLDVFAGARKLNVEVLKRWQSFLEKEEVKRSSVLAPWFALAKAAEEAKGTDGTGGEFTGRAAELLETWNANGAGVNARLVEALAKREKPVATLKDVAAVYDAVFAAAEKEADGEAVMELRKLVRDDGAPAAVARDEVARMIRREINNKTAGLKRELEALNWTEAGAPLRGMALVDKKQPANSRVLVRGNPANRGPEVPRQFLEVLTGEKRAPFKQGSGRLELAEAIVSPGNPLTARVFVNRVWGWHFGQALVRTPSDFGVRTEAPAQRELLDWLAASFVESGWSVKALHRWIVLSRTYRQSSEAPVATLAADPDNQLVGRFNRRRLEFEAMRDTLLAVSGKLDTTAGGLPDDLTKEPFARRRTVYGFIDRQNLPGMFRTFDYPNPDVSSAGRFATTVPQQALFLMNSLFVMEQARALASRPEIAQATSEPARVQALYRVVYQREPDKEELAAAQAFLKMPQSGEPERPAAAGWAYGYGAVGAESGKVEFHAMEQRKDGRLSPRAAYPDAEFGHLSVTATGGHPGKAAGQASIRRWIAPMTGTVKIDATLGHAAEGGDGVRGVIVSSARGKLGEWEVKKGTVATTLVDVKVVAGETIDFVVEMKANSVSDSYSWAPTVAYAGKAAKAAGRAWSARKDFEALAKPVPRLTRREELAQALLVSNEVVFVD